MTETSVDSSRRISEVPSTYSSTNDFTGTVVDKEEVCLRPKGHQRDIMSQWTDMGSGLN